MTSSDIVITTSRSLPEILAEIDGQLEKITARLDGIEQRQMNFERETDKRFDAVGTQLSRIEGNQLVLAERMSDLNSKLDFSMWFIGMCFAAMAILVVLAPGIRQFWREVFAPLPKSEELEQRILSRVEGLIDEKISRLGGH